MDAWNTLELKVMAHVVQINALPQLKLQVLKVTVLSVMVQLLTVNAIHVKTIKR